MFLVDSPMIICALHLPFKVIDLIVCCVYVSSPGGPAKIALRVDVIT